MTTWGDYWAGGVFSHGEKQGGKLLEPQHRYLLWRRWEERARMVCFVGLNPSKATHEVDDHTVRRWRGFAKAWGFGGFFAANLFALRETHTKNVESAFLRRGPLWVTHGRMAKERRNDHWTLWALERSELAVACWGAAPWVEVGERVEEVERLVQDGKPLHALKVTKDGHPAHPARLRNGLTPVLWSPPAGLGLGRRRERTVEPCGEPSTNSASEADNRS